MGANEETGKGPNKCRRTIHGRLALDHPLDVHRRGGQPELNLDAPPSFEPCPAQPVQLLRQGEDPLYAYLPLNQTLFAAGACYALLGSLDQLQGPGAVE